MDFLLIILFKWNEIIALIETAGMTLEPVLLDMFRWD